MNPQNSQDGQDKHETVIGRLKEAFDGKVVFLVGAGISVDSGLPNFKGLTEKVMLLPTDGKLSNE